MAISPSTVNFTYKKYETIPPGVLISFTDNGQPLYFGTDDDEEDENGNAESVTDEWLHIYDTTYNSLKIELNTTADDLDVGEHIKTINLQIEHKSTGQILTIGSFTVTVTIQDTILLSVNPTTASFNFEIGGTTPVGKTIVVTSENSWTVAKTQAWCTLSTTTGSNTGSFQIGLVTTGLAAGVYYDIITIDDGVSQKTIPVTLTVSDQNTGTNYLYHTPSLLTFSYTTNGTTPPSQNIEINTSDTWTVSANQTWINLPVTSGSSGPSIVEVALQNLSTLSVGEHIAIVTFTVGTIVKTTTVHLNIYEFTTVLLNSTELYFADDDNQIKIATGRLDSYMQLEIASLYNSVSYFFSPNIPVFKGGASKRIGVEPKKLIGKQNLIGLADISVSKPYQPINLNITINELQLFTKNVISTENLENITFIKGEKPIDNWLSNVPKKVFLTPKATLCFSLLSENITPTSIEITGDIEKSIAISPVTSEFYTVVIPLADLGTLTTGDTINISVLSETITVVIRAEEVDHTMVYFENNNGCWDSCELLGEFSSISNYNRTTASFRKTELQSETKVIDVTAPQEYKVNTGFIHTLDEIILIDKMLQSNNIYLQSQGAIFPVYPTTKKITPYESLRETNQFSLTFKNTIEE